MIKLLLIQNMNLPSVSCFARTPMCYSSSTIHDPVPSVPFTQDCTRHKQNSHVEIIGGVWPSLRACSTAHLQEKATWRGVLHFYCNIFIEVWAYNLMTMLLAAFPHCRENNTLNVRKGLCNVVLSFWLKICIKGLEEKVATVSCNLSSTRLGTVSNQ